MQTFLPYPDFVKSAQVLDRRRLGKQRVEAYQIWNTLVNGGGWVNHPAVRMWHGFTDALLAYHDSIILEWIQRGCTNNMPLRSKTKEYKLPDWFGDEDFHISHQSNLLRKDYLYYISFFPNVPNDLPYVWPV